MEPDNGMPKPISNSLHVFRLWIFITEKYESWKKIGYVGYEKQISYFCQLKSTVLVQIW